MTTAAGLRALAGEWDELWRAAGATPFQSPAWLLPWWTHLGAGELAGVAVRAAEGELVGLAPLYVEPQQRRLLPVGIATSDYLDVLLRPGWEEPALRCIVAQLQAWADRWDALAFPQLRASSALLRAPWPAGWRCRLADGEPHPVLVPPIARGMAQNLRTARSRAARLGRAEYRLADRAAIPEFLDALCTLHGRRWSARGVPGVLHEARVRAWHAEAAPLLHDAGLLRLLALTIDGEIAAVLHGLADRQRWYYYIGAFDPRRAGLGPGTLLVGRAIELAIEEGAACFDFLRGAEPYKYRWGARDEAMHTLQVWRSAAG